MNGSEIKRGILAFNASVAAGSTTSSGITCGGAAFGTFQIPSNLTAGDVTIEFSNDNANWTAVPVASSSESNPQTPAANGTYMFPINTFAAAFFRFNFANPQVTALAIPVFLKG